MNRYLFLLFTTFVFAPSPASPEDIRLLLNSPLGKTGPDSGCATEICSELLKIIDRAKLSIDFATYGLREQPQILAALDRAERRGVKVRGVIDKDTDAESYYKDTGRLEERFATIRSDYEKDRHTLSILQKKTSGKREKCKRPEGHVGPLQCFEGQGYASKDAIAFSGDIMHHKFFVVDQTILWMGSANISDTGTGGYNANNVMLIESQNVARLYTREFNRMYEQGLFHRSKKKTRKATAVVVDSHPAQHLLVAFSPQDYAVYQAVLPVLKSAAESIDIAMFFLTHRNIARELVKARQRGVNIRVILDATGAANAYSKHQYLRDRGIALKIEDWGGKMHMKSALIDNKHLVIGSMNWTAAGESKSDENTIVVMDFKQAAKFKTFFEELWFSIDNEWLHNLPRPESPDSPPSCHDGIDNDFDGKIDAKDEDCSAHEQLPD